jgi:hypothetical protein
MDAPRLEACYFDAGGPQNEWGRMARVLSSTTSEHCPYWVRTIRPVAPAARTSALGVASHAQNTRKMDEWRLVVEAAPDGDRILLMDVDTMVLRPLDAVWSQAFDLAYTVRGKESRYPFNSGVVFLRISGRVKRFIAAWWQENLRMLSVPAYHQDWRNRFGGINQAALGAILAAGEHRDVHLLELPCLEWNCEDTHWAKFDPIRTRIVHIKSALRKAIFRRGAIPIGAEPLVRAWHTAEALALIDKSDASGDPANGRTNTGRDGANLGSL